jgi:hypothetical protein
VHRAEAERVAREAREARRAAAAARAWRIRSAQTPPTPVAPEAPVPPEAPEAAEAPEAPVYILPRGWFGFGLQCDECNAKRGTETTPPVWRFGTLPRVYSVDQGSPAFNAGIRRGDELTHINGISLLTPEGGRRFGATRPGDQVRWTLSRDGAKRTVVARAGSRPDRRFELKDLRDEVSKLNKVGDTDQLRRDIARLNREIARRRLQADQLERRAITTVPARRLRYAGVIGGTEVEVRGPGSVIVTATAEKDSLIINTGDAIVVIRVPEGLLRRGGEDKPK